MEIILEKSQIIELRLDLHKKEISIGDVLELIVNDQDQFILCCSPKQTFWSRLFYKPAPQVFSRLQPTDAKHLKKYLRHASKVRIKVVGTVPKHLSNDSTDIAHVSVWVKT